MIRWLEKNKSISIIFLVMMAIEIFLISSISGGEITKGPDFSWLYHFSVFFLFNFFFLTSIKSNKTITGKKLVLVLAISLIYSILDEIHQFFVPLRNPSIKDILIDNIGIFSSAIIYLYYSKNERSLSKKITQ